MKVRHPAILVRLVRPPNDFSILDDVVKALREAGVPPEEIDRFFDQALASEERDLLQICGQWVTLVPDE